MEPGDFEAFHESKKAATSESDNLQESGTWWQWSLLDEYIDSFSFKSASLGKDGTWWF